MIEQRNKRITVEKDRREFLGEWHASAYLAGDGSTPTFLEVKIKKNSQNFSVFWLIFSAFMGESHENYPQDACCNGHENFGNLGGPTISTSRHRRLPRILSFLPQIVWSDWVRSIGQNTSCPRTIKNVQITRCHAVARRTARCRYKFRHNGIVHAVTLVQHGFLV